MSPKWISFFFFGMAALLHVGFFIVESFLYQRQDGYKLFKVSAQDHQATMVWAFNLGFYNLFLAVGMLVGLSFVLQKKIHLAGTLVGFCGLSMVCAGMVLFFSAPHLRTGALLQMIPPLLGFAFLFFH